MTALHAVALLLIAVHGAAAGEESAAALLERAGKKREAGRFEEARADVERARLIAPEDALIDIYRGYSRLYRGGGFKEAEAGLRALIERSPAAPMPHHHYAAALAVAGRDREALREYEEALRLHRASGASGEDYVHTLTNLAMMYEGFGRRVEHEALLREARGLAPEGSVAWSDATAALARSQERQGAAARARRDLEQAVGVCARRSCDPQGLSDLELELASAAWTLGDKPGSSRWTDEARGSLQRAREAMEKAGATPVDHCRAVVGGHVRLAQAYERSGAAVAAAAAYETALRVGACAPWHPQMAFARERLWSAALETGDLETASRHFAAAEEVYRRMDDTEGRAAARGTWAVSLASAAAASFSAGDRDRARRLLARARGAGLAAAGTQAPLQSLLESLEAGDAAAASVHLSGARDVYSSARDKDAVTAAERRWTREAARLELNRAELYRAEGRFEEASRAVARARLLAPRAAQLDIKEGYARLADEGFARAQEQFRRLIAVSPADPMPHHHYAAALAFAGRRDEALREYEAALRLHRLAGDRGAGYRHTLLNVATVYERLGRLSDSQAALREALRLEPGGPAWPWITAGLARIAARSGDGAGARRLLSESLLRCSAGGCESFGEADMSLTLAALELERGGARAARAAADAAGKTLGRVADESKAGGAGERLANAELELGSLYERLGDAAAAERTYREGLAAAGESSFHPTAATLHRRLAALALSENRSMDAAKHFQSARRAFERLGDRAELAETQRQARGRP